MAKLIWYASYGSNLLKSRFMCYIQGGKPKGSSRKYAGCSDKNPPRDDRPILIPHELYFAQKSPTWEDKAVAFIKSQKNEEAKTFGRMYLITKQQFTEIVRQENHYSPDDTSIEIDFETTIKNGYTEMPLHSWYNRIIYLGDKEGYPIFTFTASQHDDDISPNEPGKKYLRTIIEGLKENGINDDEIINYLKNVEGIKGKIDVQEIKRIVDTTNSSSSDM